MNISNNPGSGAHACDTIYRLQAMGRIRRDVNAGKAPEVVDMVKAGYIPALAFPASFAYVYAERDGQPRQGRAGEHSLNFADRDSIRRRRPGFFMRALRHGVSEKAHAVAEFACLVSASALAFGMVGFMLWAIVRLGSAL